MKKLIFTLLLVPALCLSTHAQRLTSADEVLNNYFKALGGKDALMKINDIAMTSTVFYNGGNAPVTFKYKMPFKSSSVSTDDKGNVTYTQIIDGKQISTKMGGSVTLENTGDVERRVITAQLMPELYLAKKGINYTLAGTETINGKEAYKIIYTLVDGVNSWTTYYDTQTGFKIQTVVPSQNGPGTVDYSDYRETNGVKLPYNIRGFGAEVKTKAYQINTGLSDSEFVI